jgi:AraC family transcriptional regulator
MLSVERRGHVARSAGAERGWDMPVALWHAPRGFDTISGHGRGTLSHHVLSFSLSGPMAEAAVGGRRLAKTDPGALSVEAAGSENGFRALGESRFAHLYFVDGFARRLGAELYGGMGDRGGLLRGDLVFFRDPELRRVAGDYLARALDAADPPTALEMDSRANLVGLRLLGRHSVLAPSGGAARARHGGGLAPWRLRRATEWLEAHLADDARLCDLAAAVGLSERHLCTAFRVSTGRPPHRWLLERRVERAKSLLAAGPARSVTEVALACGFTSSAHFATAFRKATGQRPSAWRGSGAPPGSRAEWARTRASGDSGG